MLNKNKRNKRKFLAFALAFFFVVFIIAVLVFRHYSTNESRSAQTEVGQSAKENIAEQSRGNSRDSANKSDGTSTDFVADNRKPGDIPTSESVSIGLLESNQVNGIVYTSVDIKSSSKSGRCVFSFTSEGSKPVVQEVISTNTQCISNIPEVKFDKTGVWNLNITFYSDSTKAEVSQNVTIK